MSKRKKNKRWLKGSPAWMVAGCAGKHGRTDFQAYRNNRSFLGSSGAASPVRHIDPITGEVVTTSALEAEADMILKTNNRPPSKPNTKKAKLRAKRENRRKSPTRDAKDAFYLSWEWRTLRMEVLKTFGRVCQCCGATPKDKTPTGSRVRIVVDHIKPVSRYWHLRLDGGNLQVLCEECNQGKGAWDESDYREEKHEPGDSLTAEYRAIMRDDSNVINFPSDKDTVSHSTLPAGLMS